MTEKNQIGENETRIKNATAILRRHEHKIGYSCKVCGNPIDANSPDDVYKSSSVYQCWKFDWIERNHQCHELTILQHYTGIQKDTNSMIVHL